MKICFIGAGYVGLVSGTCFADLGNNVWCVDNDEEKIDSLNNGDVPFFEPGLQELVIKNYSSYFFVISGKIYIATSSK